MSPSEAKKLAAFKLRLMRVATRGYRMRVAVDASEHKSWILARTEMLTKCTQAAARGQRQNLGAMSVALDELEARLDAVEGA